MNQTEWPRLKDLKVQSAGTIPSSPGATFGPRKQMSHEFIWIRSGILRVTVNSVRLRGGPGTLFLIPPGAIDRYDVSKKQAVLTSFTHFNCGTMPAGWPKVSRWPVMRVLPEQNIIFDLFKQVLGYSPLADQQFAALLNPTVELMLRFYLSDHWGNRESGWEMGFSPVTEKGIHWLKQSIEKWPEKKIRLADLARQTAVSPQHLCRLFKKEIGIGPMECARLLRVESAGTMLERTHLSLKEIAARCGFENPFHFSRVFKTVYGLAPQSYREGFQKGTLFRPGSVVFSRYRLQRILLNRQIDPVPTRSYRILAKRYSLKIK